MPWPRISATIAAVVVLPFVAETSAEPRGSRAASGPTPLGSIVASTLPGIVVPPPRAASRERRPASRARAISRREAHRSQSRRRRGSLVRGLGPLRSYPGRGMPGVSTRRSLNQQACGTRATAGVGGTWTERQGVRRTRIGNDDDDGRLGRAPAGCPRRPSAPRGAGLPRGATFCLGLVDGGAIAAAAIPVGTLDRDTATGATFLFSRSRPPSRSSSSSRTPRGQLVPHDDRLPGRGALLLLPVGLVALLAVVQHVPEWLKMRYPWYIQTFNICELHARTASPRGARRISC